MESISQKAKKYTIKRLKNLSVMEALDFNGQNEGSAYAEGMKEAFRMIEREIDMCAIERYQYPMLHIRDFINKMLGRKEAKIYTVQEYNFEECKWMNRMTLSSKEKAEEWMEREQRNLGGTWRISI